jgi:excisionase family DNA binding protein
MLSGRQRPNPDAWRANVKGVRIATLRRNTCRHPRARQRYTSSQHVDSREVARLSQHRRYATVEEAANYLRVERQTIYRMLIKGKILGAFKVGSVWRIDLDELLRFLEAKPRARD